jgi:hypothetical protein
MKDPPPQQWWNTRDEDGLTGPYIAPVRMADRLGRTKLTSLRAKAVPYTNGVFKHRMEIDWRAPKSSSGALKVIPICVSPTSPKSGASLPWP